MPHIVVLGAGITGVTTAYALLQAGHEVTVIDKHRYPAMETSFANGGQLSASNAEVWTSWATISKGIRWAMKADAPLLVNPAPSWHKYSWLANFMASISKYEDSTIATTRLAIESRRHMFRIAEEERIDFDLEKRGILHIYYDHESFEAARKVNTILKRGGLDREPVNPSEIKAIEPALEGTFYGGFYTPSDATGDIHKFTRALANAAMRKGVRFIHSAEVNGIDPGDGVRVHYQPAQSRDAAIDIAADGIVICAGVASRRFAAMLGDYVNVYPVKGYSITVSLHDEASRTSAPWVSLLDDLAKIVTSRLGPDRLRVAGTAEFNGFNLDIRNDRIKPLVQWTERLFPGVETSAIVPWCGLRPMMPDMMPHVAQGRHRGVFYNTGHGHLGWTLCCATAEIAVGLISGQFEMAS